MVTPQHNDGVAGVLGILKRLNDLANEVIHHGCARQVGLDRRFPLIRRPDSLQPRIVGHLGMSRRHIIQVIFPEPFRKLDRLQRESIEILLRRVVGQMRLKDAGAEKERFLQFPSE